jgi:glutaminyl-tRNA synthetase
LVSRGQYGGYTNLRFDDTNPVTEDTEYVESIKNDVRWLGFAWQHELYASDYFDQLYEYAVKLIRKGKAYVDDSTAEQIAAQKGTPTQPGHRQSLPQPEHRREPAAVRGDEGRQVPRR